MVFMGNLDYKYHADINDDYVIPDVMVACDRKHLKGGYYSGVPKFIAETLSTATALRDKTVKKRNLSERRCGRILDHIAKRAGSGNLLSGRWEI